MVYSVSILHDDGMEVIVGPWTAEWMAEAYAETASRPCKRTVIKWQMLNAEDRRVFEPEAAPCMSKAVDSNEKGKER